MKAIFKLAKAIGLMLFAHIATFCSIIPFLTIGYTPSIAVGISSVIVFLGMSRVAVIQKRKIRALMAEIKATRRHAAVPMNSVIA